MNKKKMKRKEQMKIKKTMKKEIGESKTKNKKRVCILHTPCQIHAQSLNVLQFNEF